MSLGGTTPRRRPAGVRALEFGDLETESHDNSPPQPPRDAAAADSQQSKKDRLVGSFRVSELEMIFPNVRWREPGSSNGQHEAANKGNGQAAPAAKPGRLARWRSRRSGDGAPGHEGAVRVESGLDESPQDDPEGTDAARTSHHEPGSH